MTPSPAEMRLILTEARTALRGSHPTDVTPEPSPTVPPSTPSPAAPLAGSGVTTP